MKEKTCSIVVAEPYHLDPRLLEALQRVGSVRLGPFTREDLLRNVATAKVLMVRLGHHIDRTLLDAAPDLRYIVSATTGLAHIDVGTAELRDIKIVSLRGETDFLETVGATAEHTIALMLALARDIVGSHAQVLAGGFDRGDRIGPELRGKTLGIIGLGRLGRKVASVARSLGMTILAHDRNAGASGEGISMVSLDILLAQSDIVTLHASYDAGAPAILGPARLRAMKPGAMLINTARGELVDEDTLLKCLADGRLRAALDVAANETRRPSPDPLVAYARDHSNLLLTPHIGGATLEALGRAEENVITRLVELLVTETEAS